MYELEHAWRVDYRTWTRNPAHDYRTSALEFARQFEMQWFDVYRTQTSGANAQSVELGTFTYLYDFADKSSAITDVARASRLIVVFGFSSPGLACRDDSRLKGWLGRTTDRFGHGFDKGHYIAHSVGGRVDRSELNVFQQRRDVNRGWSSEGKAYVEMERYCARNPGTFLFSRPMYGDGSDCPFALEYGILRSDGTLQIRRFENST
jgi:hypothetical protein